MLKLFYYASKVNYTCKNRNLKPKNTMISNNNVKSLILFHCLYITICSSPCPFMKQTALNIMKQPSCSSKSPLSLCEWPGVTSMKTARYLIDPENHAIKRVTSLYSLWDTHEAVRPSSACIFPKSWSTWGMSFYRSIEWHSQGTMVTRPGQKAVLDTESAA